MISRVLVFCAFLSIALACIGGSSSGCCASPAPSCGGAPPCPSAHTGFMGYPQVSHQAGYAAAPPSGHSPGSYAQAPNAYAASKVRAAEVSDNEFMQDALKEMKNLEATLVSHLATQTSLQVDLRPYESVIVKLEDKTEERLGKIARVSLKGARTVVINVSERPSTIKAIKAALQNSAVTASVNVQQEGVVLYVATPLMTRERREKLAEEASTTLLNDYKKRVNEVYVRVQKRASTSTKNADVEKKTKEDLLALKRSMEEKGVESVRDAKKILLQEVI
ncbi:hypothetical protein PFISCL1PPCAC_19515 [Pristionchus fissidentatus]|uniref:Ribosome-recycling factor, mitochondrial n=1 Tax=Pristionchus fissidentatus TaxID=1538716 RepID=A0AAV5W9M2_9BILA|nr:hypothetical protein PFISCL1PPCAC_19515 [Pristionchus fissidentatus]